MTSKRPADHQKGKTQWRLVNDAGVIPPSRPGENYQGGQEGRRDCPARSADARGEDFADIWERLVYKRRAGPRRKGGLGF